MDYSIQLLVVNFIFFLVLPSIAIGLMVKLLNWFIDDTRKFPLNDVTRHSAGVMLRDKLKTKSQLLYLLVGTLPFVLMAVYAVYMLSGFEKVLELKWLVYFMLLILLMHVYFIVRYLFVVGQLKLKCLGEDIVGEELNQLMIIGFRVYHDIKVNNISIDHLLIGSKGVFAVSVVSHAKVLSKKSQQFRMKYENQSLVFPNLKDKKSIQTAQKQAGFAMAWLKKVGGNVVKVRPVLVIPGWYIEEFKDRPPFPIITTKQINTFFSRIGQQQIDEYTLEKLVDLIEQKPIS